MRPCHPALRNHPWLDLLFGLSYWRIVLLLALPGVLLHLPLAPIFDVHSIDVVCVEQANEAEDCDPEREHDVGITHQANWLLVIPLLVPVIIATLSTYTKHFYQAVKDLEAGRIIKRKDTLDTGLSGVGFADLLTTRVGDRAQISLIVLVSLVFPFLYVDTIDLTAGYWYNHTKSRQLKAVERDDSEPVYVFQEEDWSVAFAFEDWQKLEAAPGAEYREPNSTENLIFVVYAYALQGLLAFLAVFWLIKILQSLVLFAGILEKPDTGYTLVPDDKDPNKKLGLSRLGQFYNALLFSIVAFEVYVLAHRIQQVELAGQSDPLAYLERIWEAIGQRDFFNPEIYAFSSMDLGMYLQLFVLILPVGIVCWLPLFKLRAYVEKKKNELADEYRHRREQASQEDEDLAEDYQARISRLDKANVWPNGDAIAWRLLILMLALWLCAILPPALPVMVSAGLVGEMVSLLRRVVARRAQDDSG